MRRSCLLALTLVGPSALAVPIQLTSAGEATFTPSGNYVETVLHQVGGLGALTQLGYVADESPFFGAYTGPGGRMDVELTFVGYELQGDSQTDYGVWRATGGTGGYAGASGGGTWSTNLIPNGLGTHAYFTTTILSGNVEPVPEPASLAALGLGALTALRRRRPR